MSSQEQINLFLVDVFNNILQLEEKALAEIMPKNLSLKEIHTIEAICKGMAFQSNTATEIASRLGITVGSLTVAVNTLVRKGYVLKVKSEVDRRVVYLQVTDTGKAVNQLHSSYHVQMVKTLTDQLGEGELAVLAQSLDILQRFFKENKQLHLEVL